MHFVTRRISSQLLFPSPSLSSSSRKCHFFLTTVRQTSSYSSIKRLNLQLNPICGTTQRASFSMFAQSVSWKQKAKNLEDLKSSSNKWPKPSEIPYQAKVANSVNLIGHIQLPVHLQESPTDGKYWAATLIAQENRKGRDFSPSLLIPVVFEGDLAHIVACHVKQNDCVYVSGELCVEPMPVVLSELQGKFHLKAQNLNFVQGFTRSVSDHKSMRNDGRNGDSEGESVTGTWRDLVMNPKLWWDFREQKANGLVKEKYPDFKHKEGKGSLWLNTAPDWVLAGLEGLEVDVKKVGTTGRSKDGREEELWKSLAENPERWWDNRIGKRNIKAPDFKHKETGEGLWLDSLPDWVMTKLPPLKDDQNAAARKVA